MRRLQLFSGQSLYASDFEYIETFDREMRWLHNQSLHQPGIGKGFAVRGEVGEREVKIEPGYAIDSEGREIILTKIKDLPIPPVVGNENNKPVYYDLTVSYPDEIMLEERESRQGICHEGGTVRLGEEPNFCWVELELDSNNNLTPTGDDLEKQIREGLRIIIMRAEIQSCKLNKKISIAQRRNARLTQGNRIVSGSYFPDPEKEEWELWRQGGKNSEPLGLKIFVNTSSAKFTIPPRYKAQVVGQRYVDETIDFNIDYKTLVPYLLEGFTNPIPRQNGKLITTGFYLFILMPRMNFEMPINYRDMNNSDFFDYTDSERNRILHKLGWYVEWLGIEG